MNILSIQQVSKQYGKVCALQNVSIDIPQGSVFGILGPNGSGKTTLLGIVLDVLRCDAGSYEWLGGEKPHLARRQIGTLLETPNFYHYLSAVDNLQISAAIKQRGADDIERVLGVVGLSAYKDRQFSAYSLGMKQRLAIGAALLGRPRILILDEPTNGLDPTGIAELRALIVQLSKEGITIIMASHLLDEVERVCTHVAILKKGKLLASGTVGEILRKEKQLEVKADDMDALYDVLLSLKGVKVLSADRSLTISAAGLDASELTRYCAGKGVYLSHISESKQSLEHRFIELTAAG